MDKLTLFSQSMISIAEHLDQPSKVFTSPRRTPAVEALGIKEDPFLSQKQVKYIAGTRGEVIVMVQS